MKVFRICIYRDLQVGEQGGNKKSCDHGWSFVFFISGVRGVTG